MGEIFSRKPEQKKLETTLKSPRAEFLAVYGRRRVGKTHLIRHFFQSRTEVYFEMTGAKNALMNEQLVNFKNAFIAAFPKWKSPIHISNWTDALMLLKEGVESIKHTEKIVLFFDEAPWIASRKSGFLSAIEHSWNRYLSEMNQVILIICGSSASWMIDKIVDNRGGLYGRLTETIHLQPFNLGQVEQYLKALGVQWDQQQIVDFYLAVGGVAKYQSFVKRQWSAAQAIQHLIFEPNGLMHDEFNRLFASLFDNDERHMRIIKQLASTRKGLTFKELIKKADLSVGGNSSRAIKELEKSGFITYIPQFKGAKKGGVYRLTDEYSIFHLHWVDPLRKRSIDAGQENYWLHKQNSKSWLSWAGYAFESICLKHIAQLKKILGISGVISYQTGWRSKETPGVEIDLIIEREDRCINLCEIKYSQGLYQLDKAYVEKMRRRKQLFIQETGTRKAVFITFITPYGLEENHYFHEIVDQSITLEALFEEV